MSFLTNRTRGRIGALGFCVLIVAIVWMLQMAVLSQIRLDEVQCNLVLTFTIVWGITFGSPLEAPTLDELRLSTLKSVLLRQLLSGSLSGALLGAVFSSLYSSVLPIYPIAYPIVGWTAGYFCLKKFNRALIFCIPLVLIFTFLSEMITAIQLLVLQRPGVIENFVRIVLPEGVLNSLIAPFIFFPMRGWIEFTRLKELEVSR